MPKLKTKRTLYKRIKITKRGKILRRRAGKSHLLTGKSRKKKRGLKRSATLDKTTAKTFKNILNI